MEWNKKLNISGKALDYQQLINWLRVTGRDYFCARNWITIQLIMSTEIDKLDNWSKGFIHISRFILLQESLIFDDINTRVQRQRITLRKDEPIKELLEYLYII